MNQFTTVGVLLLTLVASPCSGGQYSRPPDRRRGSTEDGSEKWGYSTPRTGVHLFWWLYQTTHASGFRNKPLIIWIQGGPALSGTALGNFAEIGPLDTELNERTHTWLREASLLFFDSPAGTGFSYFEEEHQIPNTIQGIADDLFGALLEVLAENPAYLDVPVYIFGQSYGGKMGSAFAKRIQQDIGVSLPHFDLRGVCLGNSFVSPGDTLMHYGNFLFEMSLIDEANFGLLQRQAKPIYDMIRRNDSLKAAEAYGGFFDTLLEMVPGLNLYNVHDPYPVGPTVELFSDRLQSKDKNADSASPVRDTNPIRFSIYDLDLNSTMNGPVREKLGIIPDGHYWDAVGLAAYYAQEADIFRSATDIVEDLLSSGVHVFVYQGQLDVICNIAGALSWVRHLRWEHDSTYPMAPRTPLYDPDSGKLEMFAKDHHLLHMYWILNSGHAVPDEAPGTALRMLQRILET